MRFPKEHFPPTRVIIENILLAILTITLLVILTAGCISPVAVTFRPFTIELEAPAPHAD